MRDALGLERCHLFGQSWGGWLAIEYLCRGAEGIEGLILASTSASHPPVHPRGGAPDRRPAGAAPHGAAGARRARRVRRPGVPGRRRRVLPATPLPPRPVAGSDAADRRRARRQPVVPDAQRPDRVRRDRGAARRGTGAAISPASARRRWSRAVRYDEITPACSETIAERCAGRAHGRVRGERALRAPRGARPLRGGRRGVPPGGRGPARSRSRFPRARRARAGGSA